MSLTGTRNRIPTTCTPAAIAAGAYASETAAVGGLMKGMPAKTSTVYFNHDGLDSHVKGSLGEEIMHRVLRDEFLAGTGNWVSLPPRSAPQGLDGLFLRVSDQGYILTPLVVEAKYNTSQLGHTQDGRQMSGSWIRSRIQTPSVTYRELIWNENEAPIHRGFVPEDVEANPVPLDRGRIAHVWKKNGQLYLSAPEGVKPVVVRSQIKQVADVTEGVAEGKVTPRVRLFRYQAKGAKHEITLQALADNGKPLYGEENVQIIVGRGEDLPATIKTALQNAFYHTLEIAGMPARHAKTLARKFVNNPEIAERLGIKAQDGYITVGETAEAFSAASLMGALTSGFIGAARDLFGNATFDGRSIAKWTAAGGAGTASTYLSGAIIHHTLIETETGQQLAELIPTQSFAGQSIEEIFSTTGGTFAGSGVYVATLFLLGQVDSKTAKRQASLVATRLLVSKGSGAAIFALVAKFGTASPGTPIAQLSGAAATNATLSKFCFGTLSSIGLGVKGGMIVLGASSIALGVVAVATLTFVRRRMSEAELLMTVKGRYLIVKERVANGKQPEWTHLAASMT